MGNSRERRGEHSRPQDRLDKAVGLVAALLGVLVVAASVPSPSKTGLLGTTGALLWVFGYLLGARWLGGVTIIVSSAAILVWMLA
jgi:hypothetical protein